VAVTPYVFKAHASQFDSGQGFVSTFSGTNVVYVAEDCKPGDVLVAVPPTDVHTKTLHAKTKHRGSIAAVIPVSKAKGKLAENEHVLLNQLVVGRCVHGARAGERATVVQGPIAVV